MEHIKHIIDMAALIAVLANIFNHMPAALTVISSLSAILWYWIQIMDFKSKKDKKDGE